MVEFYELKSLDQSIVFFSHEKKTPSLIYWGDKLGDLSEVEELVGEENGVLFAGPDENHFVNLFPENTKGWINKAPLKAYSESYNSIESDFILKKVERKENTANEQITFFLQDQKITVELNFIFSKNGLLLANTSLRHALESPLNVEYISNPLIPIPSYHSKIKYWTGKWCGEFTPQNTSWTNGMFSLENRTGRTSHEFFPAVITYPATTACNTGEVLSAHLGWSGNWFIHLEQTAMNEKLIHSGIYYLPNEKQINPQEILNLPFIFLTKSKWGFNDASQKYHHYVRENFLKKNASVRLVHFNSWEAIYFRHDLNKLKQLIALAEKVGVERFIIDDGWFKDRNDDTSSLGDWEIDEKKYPRGFSEIVDAIEKAKMDFGLWVEPEMISPKSELFKEHPEWVLGSKKSLTIRHQLVLNLALSEVQDYLWEMLNKILTKYPIRYLKWDMNRYYLEFTHEKVPLAEKQVHALYDFLNKLKKKHPKLEIESCASGGGRIDYGILNYVSRFWLSDHGDMHDRVRMHSEATYFFPPEVFGCHIHPSKSHTSGRQLSYEFISLAAAFSGHLGLELDLTKLSAVELEIFEKNVTLYKKYRSFLREAKFHRLESHSKSHLVHLYLQDDQFILIVFQLAFLRFKIASSISLVGLKPSSYYRVKLIASSNIYASGVREQKTKLNNSGLTLSGRVLHHQGFKLPSGWPDQAWVYHGKS